MAIKKIRLKNFKNFEDVEVDFGMFNVIVGANATGKSNLISAIKFIRDIRELGLENAISLCGGAEFIGNNQKRRGSPILIEISYSLEPTLIEGNWFENGSGGFGILRIPTVSYSIEFSISSKNKPKLLLESMKYSFRCGLIKHIEFSYNRDHAALVDPEVVQYSQEFVVEQIRKGSKAKIHGIVGKTETLRFEGFPDLKIDVQDLFPEELLPGWGRGLFEIGGMNPAITTLLNSRTSYPWTYPLDFLIYDFDLKKAKGIVPISSKINLEENGENLAIVIKRILGDFEEAQRFNQILHDILPFIQKVGVDRFFDKSLVLAVNEIYAKDTRLPSQLLSDGTISVTAIVAALYFERKEIAIFEEPERGIHPALIGRLVKHFYAISESKQLIITTHNPEVLKHTHLEDIRLVTRGEDGFGQVSKPADKEMVKAYLENDVDIAELFTQNLLDI